MSTTTYPAITYGNDLVIDALGRKATDCELKAASAEHIWEKQLLLNRAAQHREQQAEVMEGAA